MEESKTKNEVLIASAELVKLGLVARTWGNISCRIDDKRFAITPSGISYERLTPEMIVVVDMNTLEHEGSVKPSSEKGIHADTYKSSPEINFIIHTHQTYATCLSVAGFSNLQPTAEEGTVLGGDITLARYGLPGTKKLRKNVAKALEKGGFVVLMEKHGALIADKNREGSFKRAVTLEDVCKRAMAPLDIAGNHIDGMSCLQEGKLIYDVNGSKEGYYQKDNDLPFPLKIHSALLRANPDAKVLIHSASDVSDAILKDTQELPAILDDFAQMVGCDAKGISSNDIPQIIKAMHKRNGVFVEGPGAVCYAKNESDAKALLTLTEKNALAFLNARQYGSVPALSWLDRKLMRMIYLRKYSKKI